MIGEQIEKFAAAKDKAVEESAGAKVATLGAPTNDQTYRYHGRPDTT